MYAVITAGAPIDGAYAQHAGTTLKALAPIRGRSMLAGTIDALQACAITQIAVVGNEAVRASCDDTVRMVADAGTGSGNILGALDAWPDDAPLLYLTCDMPYISAGTLQWFLDRIDARTLAMPLTEYHDFTRRFPGAPPFGVALAGERVVNGGVFYLPRGSRARVRNVATAMFEARKAPWKMAAIAGPLVLLQFVLGRASVPSLEARATRVLGVCVAALRGAPPELAFDADTADEYAYASTHA